MTRIRIARCSVIVATIVIAYCHRPSGPKNYALHCAACHEAGAGGAPQPKAHRDWEIRRNQTTESLLASVRQGCAGMPPSGRCANCTDKELIDIIRFMKE